jgi:FkbH-like protein
MPANLSAGVCTPDAHLDYLRLIKEARSIDSLELDKTVRLAIVADFAAQQLTPLLKVLFARRGFRLEVYEAGYDTIDLEILNPASALYAFEPQFVAILNSAQKLKTKLYTSQDRSVFAEQAVARFTGLWAALRENSGATIIQSNFVIPSERAFGNYELKIEHSVGAIFSDINCSLARASRNHKNVLLCDVDFLASEIGRANWSDERLWSMAKTFCKLEHLPHFAKSITDIVTTAQGLVVKCVVLDLDNTLWGGVIGDDGISGILLGGYDEGESFVNFQHFLLELKRRGIILTVVSKNEHAAAISPFREHPDMVLKESDIAVFVANWDNKADNIKLVQKTLNIGFDAMVFVDDNPFERNIVREHIPKIIVPELPDDPAEYIRALTELNLFETASYSEADSQRADQYREQAQRELVKTSFTNVDDYLISLGMEMQIERFKPANLPRIAQLIQRSNQFNLTTRRYGEAACEKLMSDTSYLPFTVSLNDKFGDYGLISVIILKIEADALVVDEYLMSCRVLQRGVESMVITRIVEFARQRGLSRIIGKYIRTTKNDMVKNFYANFGFEKISESESGDSDWELATETYKVKKTFIANQIMEL